MKLLNSPKKATVFFLVIAILFPAAVGLLYGWHCYKNTENPVKHGSYPLPAGKYEIVNRFPFEENTPYAGVFDPFDIADVTDTVYVVPNSAGVNYYTQGQRGLNSYSTLYRDADTRGLTIIKVECPEEGKVTLYGERSWVKIAFYILLIMVLAMLSESFVGSFAILAYLALEKFCQSLISCIQGLRRGGKKFGRLR